MEICTVDRDVLEQAIALNLPDFEDAVRVACATMSDIAVIATRDVKGFTGSHIPALAPDDLRKQLVAIQE